MSENTKIEWCDHTSKAGNIVPMNKFVTGIAKGCAVFKIKPLIRVTSPMKNVMRVQVPTGIVAAVQAHPSITGHDIVPPPFARRTEPNPSTLQSFSIYISRSFVATKRYLSHGFADFVSNFISPWNPFCTTGKPRRPSHVCPSLFAEFHTLHWRCSAFCLNSYFHARAIYALCRQPVKSRFVNIEIAQWMPFLAAGASLLCKSHFSKCSHIHTRLFCGNFQSTFRSLSHGI